MQEIIVFDLKKKKKEKAQNKNKHEVITFAETLVVFYQI